MPQCSYIGFSPEITEEQLQNQRTSYENQVASNSIILGRDVFRLWTNEDRIQKEDEVRKDYVNTKDENYNDYFSFEGVTLHAEPEACAQQLYAILNGIIQEVITK